MARKGKNWLTTTKYNLRRNYHHYNLRSAPLRTRRQPIVPRRTVLRQNTSSNPPLEVAIINVNPTLHSSLSESNSSDDTVSDEYQPETMQRFPGYGRLRFPFSISQPVAEYRSPRIIDNLASGDGLFNNLFSFQIIPLGPENQEENEDESDYNDGNEQDYEE